MKNAQRILTNSLRREKCTDEIIQCVFRMNGSGLPDALGIVGLAFAVMGIGISEAPPVLRVSSLLLSALTLSISFRTQVHWPLWVRWALCMAADSILAYIGWSIVNVSS